MKCTFISVQPSSYTAGINSLRIEVECDRAFIH